MILKIMGLFDLFVAFNLIARAWGWEFQNLIFIAFGYLLIKGLLFFKDPMSILELLIGIILISSLIFTWPKIVLLIAALIVLQKGAFSLLS
ncbi:hypothetical protein ACFLZZ_02035 [Nanoarchaeota archaeon]